MAALRRLTAAALAVGLLCYLACAISWTAGGGSSSGERVGSTVRQISLELQHLKRTQATLAAEVLRQSEEFSRQREEIHRLQLLLGTPPPPPPSPPPPPLAVDHTHGNFLVASELELGDGLPDYPRRLLRGMLGVAALLNRTLVLPAQCCDCHGGSCGGAPHPLFGCRLGLRLGEGLAELLPTRPVRWLRGQLPDELRCSHVRVLLNPGLDSEQLAHALRHYASTRILELASPAATYCGLTDRPELRPPALVAQERRIAELLRPPTDSEESTAPSLLPPCQHSLKEEEVTQYWDVGKCVQHVVKVELPPKVAALPPGSDLIVTFSTGSVATMAHNWYLALRRSGVDEGAALIGALDEKMREACVARGLPCVGVDGGKASEALQTRKTENVRGDPKLYPMMSVLKVGFYYTLLKRGLNVWACDADALFMSDPRPLMRTYPWTEADLAVATDCIDLPADKQSPLLHCDFNTGLVFLRASAAVLEFAEQWREKIANAKEARIRDQAAFNMITKAPPGLKPLHLANGSRVPRLYTVPSSAASTPLRLGVFPLHRFLNGHTLFVQHAHTLPHAELPVSVHMTYQFAEGSSFAYGKRQRLREAGLWFVDDDAYYAGRFVTVSAAGGSLPREEIGLAADSRDAVRRHLAEHAHRTAVLRALLGIGKALGRAVVLPRMLCYCDYLWKEMKACRVGGAETMRLPFDCPMDHVLDTPRFFENTLGVEIREPNFLSNPRVPLNVSQSIARVSLPERAMHDGAIRAALAQYAHVAVIEIERVDGRFCGFEDAQVNRDFAAESHRVLSYKRVPFCTMEGSDNAPLYSRCCEPWHEGEKYFPCIYGFDDPAPLPKCAATAT
ncbi:hypothetical protein AB1Y20_007608 [Prymnesium parvum]|uniref:Nucleotide-diphospho-sugar transferase domain-containing protein n=1 Tax=Prymnesium parvum TaxID=97485 RepID=A0AB34IZB1_PRYPA